MNNLIYWLWATSKKNISNKMLIDLLKLYKTPKALYEERNFKDLNIRTAILNSLRDKSLDMAKKIKFDVEQCGAYIVTIDDKRYPSILKNIYDFPCLLYAKGEWIDFDKTFTIGIVGTRSYTGYGRTVTAQITRDLVQKGVVTVSGFAKGIDTTAAQTTIKFGGKTVAVLGCGLDKCYPAENYELMGKVVDNGLLISEYPPGSAALPYHFPQRNRIIVGLSRGILVVESCIKGGSLITANIAIENNRDVFAVPGSIFNASSAGTHNLIADGAKLTTCADDILEAFPNLGIEGFSKEILNTKNSSNANKKTTNKSFAKQKISHEQLEIPDFPASAEKSYDDISENSQRILNVLKPNGEHDLLADEITRLTDLSNSVISAELIMLELSGYIHRTSDGRYRLI